MKGKMEIIKWVAIILVTFGLISLVVITAEKEFRNNNQKFCYQQSTYQGKVNIFTLNNCMNRIR